MNSKRKERTSSAACGSSPSPLNGERAGVRGEKFAGVPSFSRRELRDACGWSLTQVRVHLERLVELEYLAVRHGRIGSQFVYEILFDLDVPEAVAHVGLLDVGQLRRNLAGFGAGVAGQNGHLAGGDETPPPPVRANADRHLLHT